MPWLRLPLRLHVAEEPLEAGEESVAGTGEGEDGRPEEGDDGDRRPEDDLRSGILGALARTHLPLGQVPERGAEWRRRDRGEAVARDERPLDLVHEPADGDLPPTCHPRGGRPLVGDGQHGERPDPGQLSSSVGLAQDGRLPRLPLESDERPCLPRRDAESLA